MFNTRWSRVLISSFPVGLYLYHQWKKNPKSFPKNTSSPHASSVKTKMPLSPYRPSDWLHVYYAKEAYKKNGGKLATGWEILKCYQELKSGYFGVAYRHPTHKHIIIAHRGTEDCKDLVCDFNTMISHLNEQEVSAWNKFAKKVIEKQGPSYTYSFTGHSLGGWLAEACLWKYQDEFFEEQYPAYQDAFSVTLDDPGGKELLEALQPRVGTSYKIAVDKLDRTNYVSCPNLVNTALGREGATVYTLLPGIEPSWMIRNTLLFTIKMHSSQRLFEQFDEKTGLPKACYRVLDWPRVVWGKGSLGGDHQKGLLSCLAYFIEAYRKGDLQRDEYLGFYTYGNDTVNDPQQLPPVSQFRLQHGIHYRTTAFEPHILPLINMPRVARKFLEELSHYPNRVEVITELMEKQIGQELSTLLDNYRINEREECVLDPCFSARTFREELLKFLSVHPFFYESSLRVLREEYILKQMKAKETREILHELDLQVKQSKALILDLSFNQGTTRLYQFIKPSWDDIKSLEDEQSALRQQLSTLKDLKLVLEATPLEVGIKAKANVLLQCHEEQLEIAEQSVNALMHYLNNRFDEANKNIEGVISKVKNLEENNTNLDKNLLLNRAYNLKAKIAVRMKNLMLAKEYYQEAISFLPEDFLTASNYGGLLTDWGRSQKKPMLYVEAYRYFQKVYVYLAQIKPSDRSVIYSGMAYNFLLLAQSLEKSDLKQEDIADISLQQLRMQARDLLKPAIIANPHYLNARLFLAILYYDEKNYPGALQEVNMALTLQPQHATALMRKGFILDKLERPEEALNALRQSKSMMLATQANASWLEEVDEKITKIEGELKETKRLKF